MVPQDKRNFSSLLHFTDISVYALWIKIKIEGVKL
jgi:hypothetical protein